MRSEGTGLPLTARVYVPVLRSDRLLTLLRVVSLQLVCGPAQKQPLPIRKRNVLADRTIRPILCLIAVYHQLGSRRQGIFRKPEPEQGVRAASLDHP